MFPDSFVEIEVILTNDTLCNWIKFKKRLQTHIENHYLSETIFVD